MKQCPNCFRTFREEALVIHLRSCRPDRVLNPLKHLQGEKTDNFRKTFTPNIQPPDAFTTDDIQRVECSNCGRKFAPDRIEKHVGVC